MIRFTLALLAVALIGQNSFGQLFPNAFWNSSRFNRTSENCPNGQCPNSPLQSTASAGHWSYPGTITNHLEGAHGVPTNGMTREQKLELHDALHEGRAPAMKQTVPAYAAASYAVQSAPIVVVRSGGSCGSVASFGSSGSLAVGQRDKDGAIISSVGSTVSPSISTQAITPLAIGDRIAFRRSLLEAARNARKSGEITSIQFFMLSAASRNPAVLDKMQQAVHEAAIEEGLATAQAIDWDSLISFIEKLIPIIIQLIDLFSYNQPHSSQSFEATGFDPYTLAA